MITDRKITAFASPVSSLADKPQMSAADLKAVFDSNTQNEVKTAVNGVIDDLSGEQGAENIGWGESTVAGMVLAKDNTAEYTPAAPYHPATKAYVDNKVVEIGTGDMAQAVYDTNSDGTVNDSDQLGGKLPGYYGATAAHNFSDGIHTLTTDFSISSGITTLKFKATADFTSGDTFTVNGTAYTAAMQGGDALDTDAFVTGDVVQVGVDLDAQKLVFKGGGGLKVNGATEVTATYMESIAKGDVLELYKGLTTTPEVSIPATEYVLPEFTCISRDFKYACKVNSPNTAVVIYTFNKNDFTYTTQTISVNKYTISFGARFGYNNSLFVIGSDSTGQSSGPYLIKLSKNELGVYSVEKTINLTNAACFASSSVGCQPYQTCTDFDEEYVLVSSGLFTDWNRIINVATGSATVITQSGSAIISPYGYVCGLYFDNSNYIFKVFKILSGGSVSLIHSANVIGGGSATKMTVFDSAPWVVWSGSSTAGSAFIYDMSAMQIIRNIGAASIPPSAVQNVNDMIAYNAGTGNGFIKFYRVSDAAQVGYCTFSGAQSSTLTFAYVDGNLMYGMCTTYNAAVTAPYNYKLFKTPIVGLTKKAVLRSYNFSPMGYGIAKETGESDTEHPITKILG